MNEKILTIGLDVDDKFYHSFALDQVTGEGFAVKCRASAGVLLGRFKGYIESGYKLDFCYESGHIGFSLYRELKKAGHKCSIVASGLIPELSSNRVKNDRLDAEKLSLYYAKGLLTVIHVPEAEDEDVRALIRSSRFLKEQLKAIKIHIVSLTKLMGWNYRQEMGKETAHYWTDIHYAWLKAKLTTVPSVVRMNFQMLQGQMESLENCLEGYQREILRLSQTDKYKERVKSLTCYRGLEVLGAMTITTELGDVRRFSHPRKLVSYLGLDVSEHSSGGKEKKFSITKMGNKHVRTVLVEASQNYQRRPQIGRALKVRRESIDPNLVAIADRCMRRLDKKALNLGFKNKPSNKIKIACAREFAGFIWESLSKVS